jgi:hypothetical protein
MYATRLTGKPGHAPTAHFGCLPRCSLVRLTAVNVPDRLPMAVCRGCTITPRPAPQQRPIHATRAPYPALSGVFTVFSCYNINT